MIGQLNLRATLPRFPREAMVVPVNGVLLAAICGARRTIVCTDRSDVGRTVITVDGCTMCFEDHDGLVEVVAEGYPSGRRMKRSAGLLGHYVDAVVAAVAASDLADWQVPS